MVTLLAHVSPAETKCLLLSKQAENRRTKCVCCPLFFGFCSVPLCALLTCRQVANCRGLMRSNCVLLSSFSRGGLFVPQLDFQDPPPLSYSPQRPQFDREVKQIKWLPRHNAFIVTVEQFWLLANLCTF